jgi:hypothetical protein
MEEFITLFYDKMKAIWIKLWFWKMQVKKIQT